MTGREGPGGHATGNGAGEAVEALAETTCFLDRHRHTATHPTCFAGRDRADRLLALLSLNRKRASAVGGYLEDKAVQSITAAIASAEL